MASENELILKKINQLYDEKFYIPSYQRGYRWTENQVIQLLEDIWEFAQKQNDPESFYCLQPIVVKLRNNSDRWEVIDGQQRITTISLIIRYFNEIYGGGKRKIHIPEIEYETRRYSYDFISNIEIVNSEEELDWEKPFVNISDDIITKCQGFLIDSNIDFYHIATAYKAIHYWFMKQGSEFDDAKFKSVFLAGTRIIWYETEETENNKSVDVFTRLNIGKIPLTNSELIKALFLMKNNFSQEKATLKQIQIATEWDFIERTLQNDDFWYFVYNPDSENAVQYETRIEYIFDLMKGKKKQYEFYYTFFKFHEEFEKEGNNIDALWLKVKKYFLTFEEWYNDFELYHLIGYLIDCNDNSEYIASLQKDSMNMTKSVFKDSLFKKIRSQVYDKDVPLEDLTYDNRAKVRKILLLFNIETILQSGKHDMRFPFYKYKTGKWDIEHVDSLTEKYIQGEDKRRAWLDDVKAYFDIHPNPNFDNRIKDLEKQGTKLTDDIFIRLFDDLRNYFEKDKCDKNSISNLALLDSETNRSYKNSFFPLKRYRIIENDKKGIFVPIATKNLFMKYYTEFPSDLDFWNKNDADAYFSAIKLTLHKYLEDV